MDKPNVFRTSEFFMSEGDTLKIRIKDFCGDPISLNLTGADSGVVSDGDIVTDGSAVTVTFVAGAYWGSTLTILSDIALGYAGTNKIFLNISVLDTDPLPNLGWAKAGMLVSVTDAASIAIGRLFLTASSDVPYTFVGEIEIDRDIVALDEITVTIIPDR